MKISVIFDNYVFDNRLTAGWGFSCLVETAVNTILFDTGGDSSILLNNMSKLQIEPQKVDAVVLSHIDGDHTDGLGGFLEHNNTVPVYLPRSFPDNFKQRVKSSGAKLEEVSANRELLPGVYTTGELGKTIKEQSLIVETDAGLVVITGCAHPGIVEIVKNVKLDFPGKNIHLAMGGFHLKANTEAQNMSIIDSLQQMGVVNIAPSHCSGDKTRRLFKKQYGSNYIDSGAGKIIDLH